MSTEFNILMISAASLGFLHTLLGPDHYLPFIVMGKARRWSIWKTGGITIACGIGHIGSSVLLGLVGIALGIAVKKRWNIYWPTATPRCTICKAGWRSSPAANTTHWPEPS